MHKEQAAVTLRPADFGSARIEMLRELTAAGVTLRAKLVDGQACAHGESMRLDARGISSTDSFRLIDALADDKPVSITAGLPPEPTIATDMFRTFCGRLRELLVESGTNPAQITLVVGTRSISVADALRIRQRELGPCNFHFVIDEHTDRRDWLALWKCRNFPWVSTVLPASVSASSPLLASEVGCDTIPDLALCAPAGSAWTPLGIDLCRFADRRGRLRAAALERALTACVEIGDLLHDELPRYSSSTRHDAWFNRRLSIELTGIGDLAVRRNVDPGSFAALDELRSLIESVRSRLHSLSADVAKRRGIVPSLRETDPTRRLPAGARHADWRMRWKRAVNSAAVRHRNLVTISPWSVISSLAESNFGFIDMLPMIECADTLGFKRRASLSRWNLNEFMQFHERMRAVLRKRQAAFVFAQRV